MIRTAAIALALVAARPASPGQDSKSPPSGPERGTTSLSMRFIRERVVACEDHRFQFYRPRPACRAARRIVSGTALVELIPMPDARRDLFGPDRRKRITLELRCDDRAAERTLTVERGPWLIVWKNADRSIHVDLGPTAKLLRLSTQLGACESRYWRCRLDPAAASHHLDLRDTGHAR